MLGQRPSITATDELHPRGIQLQYQTGTQAMHSVKIRPHIIDRVTARRGKSHWFESLDKKRTALVVIDMQRCDLDNPISVSEACLMRQFGCASTVHHLIQKLSATGLILLGVDQKDRRKKFISLSTNGLRYFEQIEDCLDAALMHQ